VRCWEFKDSIQKSEFRRQEKFNFGFWNWDLNSGDRKNSILDFGIGILI
jgi:hypothetical protein